MADAGDNDSPLDPQPSVKRRSGKRTARACDECRMRKAKCDGLTPCESCTNADRYCTYNLSAGRSTGSGTRIRILEDRLRRARAYLQEAQKRTPSLQNVNFDVLLEPTEVDDASAPNTASQKSESDSQSAELESMMDAYGQLGMDVGGKMERNFFGAASGLAWIQRANRYLTEFHAGQDADVQPEQSDPAAIQLFDAPLPRQVCPDDNTSVHELLPPREVAESMLRIIFTQVYPLFHFLDEGYFSESMDEIYRKHPFEYDETDQQFLTLFLLVIGLGYLFSRTEHDKIGCRKALAEAMRHFVVGRSMLDIAHMRTLRSLQSVVCMVLFLISTARVASGHAFVGVACAAAMRQGLHHRSTHESSLPAKERRVRRRVFWAVMNLDMYVSGVLGLPPFIDLNAADPAIDLTIGVALKSFKSGRAPADLEELALAASARYIELMRISSKARQALFPKPLDPPDSETRRGTISISSARLHEVEDKFRQWTVSSRDILGFPSDSAGAISIKYELQAAYYFSQLVFYRAFIHYLSPEHNGMETTSRQMNYARMCLKMASKTINLSVEHQKLGLLCPASWPALYAVFISVVCLVFSFALDSKGTDAGRTREEIEIGIRLLACTACTTDTGSVRCLEILRRLIEKVRGRVDLDVDAITASTDACCRMKLESARSTSLERKEDSSHDGSIKAESQRHSSQTLTDTAVGGSGTDDGPMYGVSHSTTSPTGAYNSSIHSNDNSQELSNLSFGEYNHNLLQPQSYDAHYPEEMLNMFYTSQLTWPDSGYLGHTGGDSGPSSSIERQHAGLGHDGDGDRDGKQDGATSVAASTGSGLSAEEIAHFMHINPGDHPFPFGG